MQKSIFSNEIMEQETKKIFVANVYCFDQQRRTFCYKITKKQQDLTGSIVKVPFRNKEILGIIMSIEEIIEIQGQIDLHGEKFDASRLKTISSVVYKNIIHQQFLNFLHQMSFYNVIDEERLIQLAIPSFWLNKKQEIKPLELKKSKKNKKIVFKLTDEQQEISTKIQQQGGFNISLLQGAMGSGKTYVFLDLVRQKLQENPENQVLIMVPEISLTSQMLKIISSICGVDPIVWHSTVSNAKKKKYYEAIIKGGAKIVVSTRSGLLLPYKKLSMIVIDEEHDQSYKQNEIPTYNARDMAILRAKNENFQVILSSATPSIETIVNVMQKKYDFYNLKSQYFHIQPPEIKLIENPPFNFKQNNQEKEQKKQIISNTAREAIIETLKRKEQVMIFINRRGFSRTLRCKTCGFEAHCVNCDNLLSYHQKKGILKCHLCGYINKNIKKCQKCGGTELEPNSGVGVEQVNSEVQSFCDARTILFSSDEIQKEGDIETISNQIKKGDVDIIIGTQIMSKGHHFPRLTTIIVLDIDMALSTADGDFRSYERTFQMLYQLSGRAGREISGAKILIQTNEPENKLLQNLYQRDLKGFYKHEIQQRQKFELPPFARFVAIIISSSSDKKAFETAKQASLKLKEIIKNDAKILGPVECPIHLLQKKYRYRFLIQGQKGSKLLQKLNIFRLNFDTPNGVQLKIDVDPINFN